MHLHPMQFVGAAAIFYVGASYALGGQERVRYDLEVLQVGRIRDLL